jgi:hypothetical protein
MISAISGAKPGYVEKILTKERHTPMSDAADSERLREVKRTVRERDPEVAEILDRFDALIACAGNLETDLATARRELAEARPIDAVLFCPKCRFQHIEKRSRINAKRAGIEPDIREDTCFCCGATSRTGCVRGLYRCDCDQMKWCPKCANCEKHCRCQPPTATHPADGEEKDEKLPS